MRWFGTSQVVLRPSLERGRTVISVAVVGFSKEPQLVNMCCYLYLRSICTVCITLLLVFQTLARDRVILCT